MYVWLLDRETSLNHIVLYILQGYNVKYTYIQGDSRTLFLVYLNNVLYYACTCIKVNNKLKHPNCDINSTIESFCFHFVDLYRNKCIKCQTFRTGLSTYVSVYMCEVKLVSCEWLSVKKSLVKKRLLRQQWLGSGYMFLLNYTLRNSHLEMSLISGYLTSVFECKKLVKLPISVLCREMVECFLTTEKILTLEPDWLHTFAWFSTSKIK